MIKKVIKSYMQPPPGDTYSPFDYTFTATAIMFYVHFKRENISR